MRRLCLLLRNNTTLKPIDRNAFGRLAVGRLLTRSARKGNKMDIFENEKEWIKASNHQAFTDLVLPIVDSLVRSFYEQVAKVVGFDNLNSNNEDDTATQNAFNSIVAEVLFESMTPAQLRELLASHNTSR